MRRLVPLLLVSFTLLIAASVGQSRGVTLGGTAVFSGSANTWTMTLTGNGTDAIKCMRVFAPSGITFTSVTGPAGTNNESTSVFSNGSVNIAQNGSAFWNLSTSGPLTASNPPRVNISANCKTDAPATVIVQTASTPPPTTTAPPPPPPCECKNVKASTYGWGDFQDSTGPQTDFAFRLKWAMNCGGAAGNCKGEIDIFPPAGLKVTTPRTLKFSCAGKCRPGEGITLNRNAKPIPVRGTSAAALDKDARGGKSFTFRFQAYCIRNGKRLRSGRSTMTVTYRPSGLINTRASDLNGDGKPDKK